MTRIFEPRCKTCNSPHRTEIEEKVLDEGLSYKEASEWLEKKYQEKISRHAISRHFNKHVMKNLDLARESEMKTEEIASKEVEGILDLTDELRSSLSILKKMLNRALDQQEKEGLQSSTVNAITSCLRESRLTIKELYELTGELEISEAREEDMMEKFFSRFVDKVDPEVAKIVLDAWKETEKEVSESGTGQSSEQAEN